MSTTSSSSGEPHFASPSDSDDGAPTPASVDSLEPASMAGRKRAHNSMASPNQSDLPERQRSKVSRVDPHMAYSYETSPTPSFPGEQLDDHNLKASRTDVSSATRRQSSDGASNSHLAPSRRSSHDSLISLDDDLKALLGAGLETDVREMQRLQREIERDLERSKQEKLRHEQNDREYALQLQRELNETMDDHYPDLPASQSSFNSQRPPASIRTSLRPGQNPLHLQLGTRPAANVASALLPTASSAMNPTPAHHGSNSLSRRPGPHDFVDLGQDSDDSDDDIVILDERKSPAHAKVSQPYNRQAHLLHGMPGKTTMQQLSQKSKGLSPPQKPHMSGYAKMPVKTVPGQMPAAGYHGSAGSSVYGGTPSSSSYLGAIKNGLNHIGRAMSDSAAAAYNVVDSQIGSIPRYTGGSFGAIPDPNMPRVAPQGGHAPYASAYGSRFMPGPEDDYYGGGYAQDPREVEEHLRSLVENIRPDEDLGADDATGSPEAMATGSALYPHQKLGLAWMIKMEEGSNKGGILADAMGLGKTIQAIALMVSNRSSDPRCKTTLIVAPVALLQQWESEILHKIKAEHRLTTYIYHGQRKNMSWSKLRSYDVILTTYGTLTGELRKKTANETRQRENPDATFHAKERLVLLDEGTTFYRVILDEAQNIKNRNAKSAKACYCLKAQTRFCMTGTPMMNNVTELYSLIHFLKIQPYCEWEVFNRDFTRPLRSSHEPRTERAMQKLQALLKAVCLRRTKESTIDGKPIITLPPRETHVEHATFDDDQNAFYRALEQQTQIQFNKYLKAGTANKNYSNILTLLLRLRQACCHPHLIRDFAEGVADDSLQVSKEDLLQIARDFLGHEEVERLKQHGMSLECPICMDAAESDARIFTPCGHFSCRECFARISDPTMAADDGEGGDNTKFKCPTCRRLCDPKKVTDLRSFHQVHMPELAKAAESSRDPEADISTEEEDIDSSSSDEVESEAGSLGSMDDFIVNDESDISEHDSDSDDLDAHDAKGPRKSAPSKGHDDPEKSASFSKKAAFFERDAEEAEAKADGKGKLKDQRRRKGKGRSKGKKKKTNKTLAQLQRESKTNASARRTYFRQLEEDWVSSTKIDKCMSLLDNIKARDSEKTIIFSQFTTLLDLLEVPLSQSGIRYKRYDGSMKPAARHEAVLEFTRNPRFPVMLVSLKAGNAGLNLTAANNVIILDPFWNPYVEEQAIDRAHRIGQRRTVNIYRILIEETVEDRIIALQEKKRQLIEGALDEKAGTAIGRLGMQELGFLFGVPMNR